MNYPDPAFRHSMSSQLHETGFRTFGFLDAMESNAGVQV